MCDLKISAPSQVHFDGLLLAATADAEIIKHVSPSSTFLAILLLLQKSPATSILVSCLLQLASPLSQLGTLVSGAAQSLDAGRAVAVMSGSPAVLDFATEPIKRGGGGVPRQRARRLLRGC